MNFGLPMRSQSMIGFEVPVSAALAFVRWERESETHTWHILHNSVVPGQAFPGPKLELLT